MKRNIVVSLLLVLLMIFVVSCEEPKHEHTLEKVEAVAATCSEEGMKEYYQCSVCKLTFADKEAKTEVKDLATLKTDKDPANHAGVKKVDAVAATCVEEGMKEYYQCSGCKKNFIDAEAKTEVKDLATLKTEKDPANHSKVNKVDAIAATCIEEGMKEYYQCSGCKKNFIDAEAKTEVKDLATLKTEKDPANHSKVNKVDAVESTCTVNGTVEHWHCEGCEKNYRDEACKNELESLVAPLIIHEAGDGVVTGESFTLGEVTYPIYKCEHDVFYLDEACTERLYKDYFDAAGLVVTEKDGVLDAYFSDCDVFMSTKSASSYGFQKAVAYFTDKKFARLGYCNEDALAPGKTGMDATENKALTLTVTKDEKGSILITGESEKYKKPLTGITSITLNGDNSGLVMVANGGETWNLKPYNNPLRGTYKDSAGNILTFGRYVMNYTYSGEKAFYVADIDKTHVKVEINATNSGAHGDTTFGFRHYTFLEGDPNLYVKWDTNLVDKNGVKLATYLDAGKFYTYTPVSEK